MFLLPHGGESHEDKNLHKKTPNCLLHKQAPQTLSQDNRGGKPLHESLTESDPTQTNHLTIKKQESRPSDNEDAKLPRYKFANGYFWGKCIYYSKSNFTWRGP